MHVDIISAFSVCLRVRRNYCLKSDYSPLKIAIIRDLKNDYNSDDCNIVCNIQKEKLV